MDYRTQANLRELLAGLYYRDPDIDAVVMTVGLKPAYIAWDERPVNTWQSVLTEADNQGKVNAIIAVAKEEKPLMAASFDSVATAIPAEQMPDKTYHGPAGAEGFERLTARGSNTLRPIGFLMRGWQVSRSVGRMVLANTSIGSGFLIPNNIFITNNHVLSSPEAARDCAGRVQLPADAGRR